MDNTLTRKGILLFCSLLWWMHTIAQTPDSRNEQVRSLNYIVDYMDATSRFQEQFFYDAIWFSDAYFSNIKEVRPAAWQISIQTNTRSKSADYKNIKRLTVSTDGFIDDYQSRKLQTYRTAELLAKQLINNKDINDNLTTLSYCFESMDKYYNQMIVYIENKTFKTDNNFSKAKLLLDSIQPLFDQHNKASSKLYQSIASYYEKYLPPLPTQKTIRAAQEELLLSVNLVEKWAQQLYNDNDVQRTTNDAELKALNRQGLPKANRYLSKTYGFGYLSNGAFPHSRYEMFYKNMPTTIFWFRTDTSRQYPNMPASIERYDKFVKRYNSVMHYYNLFIECADGKTAAANLDYTTDMAAKIGVDTAQNVLLKKPRIGYRFGWENESRKQTEDKPTIHFNSDTTENRRREMISSAAPHHTIYLLDVSNSMDEYHKLDTLKQAIKSLVQLQRPVDYISMIAFADSAQKIIQYNPCDQKDFIYNMVDQLKTSGATNAEDAVKDGYSLVDGSLNYKGKTKVVIITDGQFTLTKKTKKKIEQYQTKGISLSILLLGKWHDDDTIDYFKKLCTKGNGNFYDMSRYSLQDALVREASN